MITGFNQTKVYVAACIGMMFFGVAFIVMGTVLPAMAEKYALTEAQSSLLVTFLPFGVLMGSLLFGPIADRFGYKLLLCLSTLFVALGLFGLARFDHFGMLRVSIFIIGFGGGILNGETNAIVADIYSGDKAASRLSILGVCYGFGALGVPLLVGMLSKFYSYETVLQWTAAVVMLCIVYFALVRFPTPKHKQGFPIKEAVKLVKEPALILISFILFFQSGLEGVMNNWSTTYLINAGIGSEEALLALTALVIGITLARLVLSYLILKIDTLYILAGGMLLLACAISMLHYATVIWMGMASLFFAGAGLAGVFPIMIGRIGTLYRNMTGTAIGLALFVALSGNSLLNLLMGYIPIDSFALFLITCVLSQAMLVFVGRKHFRVEK